MRFIKAIQEILELTREIRREQVELAKVYQDHEERILDLETRMTILEETVNG